jgi:hypothetical protein
MAELVASLATTGGSRAPLVHIEDRVFLALAGHLEAGGVSRKVSADMFGLALRSYLRKIRRLTESSTVQGRSLWEAVLAFLGDRGETRRSEVHARFHRDEPELVAGVLNDLTASGLIIRNGTGANAVYRAAAHPAVRTPARGAARDDIDPIIWALVYRLGPITSGQLAELVPSLELSSSIRRLVAAGRIQLAAGTPESGYVARELFVPKDAPVGWEAAVFDHLQAVIRTIVTRLARGPVEAAPTGGSTYSFEVWSGHPLEREVLQQLEAFRERTSELRARVRAFNAGAPRPARSVHVTVYGGQLVTDHEASAEETPSER